MNLDLINKLYDLIIKKEENTLENNKDLFQEFYDERVSFIKYLDYEPKIYYILEYMIKNSTGLFFEYEINNLLSLFNNYLESNLQYYPFSVDTKKDSVTVSKIFELYVHYNILKDIVSNPTYYNKLNDLDRAEVNKLLSKTNIRDFVCAFIMILNYGFFEIDEHIISEVFKFIRNNNYIDELENKKLSDMDNNFLYHYLDKFIFIRDFSTKEELANDKIVLNILKGKIGDFKLYEQLIDKLDTEILLKIYSNSINDIFNDIDNTSNLNTIKRSLYEKVLSRLLDKEPLVLYKYYLEFKKTDDIFSTSETHFFFEKNSSELISKCYDKDIRLIDEDILINLLHKVTVPNNFIVNVNNYYRNKQVSDGVKKELERFNNSTLIGQVKPYSKEEIIELLQKIFNEKKVPKQINIINLFIGLTNIITNNSVDVTLFTKDDALGYCSSERNVIGYDLKYYSNFHDLIYIDDFGIKKVIDMLMTIFHETTHYIQFTTNPTNDVEKQFYKEHIIREYYPDYYEKNYSKISYERDARIKSYELCYNFLKDNIPEMCYFLKQYYLKSYKEDIEINIDEKEVFSNSKVDIDRIFDRLVFFHPEIKEKYPQLFGETKSKT